MAESLELEHLRGLHETYRTEANVHVRMDAARALSGRLFRRFSDILAALERIPELERRLDEAIDQNMRQAGRLEFAERVEAAARFLVFEAGSESEQAVAQMALIEVLSAGPALAAAPEGEAQQPEMADDDRLGLPILVVAAWDVVEGINRCIRSGEAPSLRTIRSWGGHLAVAREFTLASGDGARLGDLIQPPASGEEAKG